MAIMNPVSCEQNFSNFEGKNQFEDTAQVAWPSIEECLVIFTTRDGQYLIFVS